MLTKKEIGLGLMELLLTHPCLITGDLVKVNQTISKTMKTALKSLMMEDGMTIIVTLNLGSFVNRKLVRFFLSIILYFL